MFPPSPDTTFAGSHNGFSPLVFWDHLARHSHQEHFNKIKEAQRLTELLLRQLQNLESTHGLDLWPAGSPGVLTVRFRRPSDTLVAKWSLSCEDVLMNPKDPTKPESWRSEEPARGVDEQVAAGVLVPRPGEQA
ncbi:hypothetical protein [Streptomyces regalis]|uniref:Uncharacterized protein n=1 Tax=Streptomyces regalis TaxID=68262 RepID=A0A0X3VET5_9ACTN|nr:hypothetical protein [Streptomyces regalis]KUL42772.1 hypothetical protein ADL12_08980 [Streptomyces regalis]